MNTLIPFQFEEQSIRVVTDESGEPLFVGKDICDALGFVNDSDAMKRHCKGVVKRYPLLTPGGVQELRVLTEPDVLRLIINSSLPSAEQFEAWVFEVVLPSIRKTGSYSICQPQHTLPGNYLEALEALVVVEKEKLVLEHQRDVAIATKAEIGCRREATSMATASAAVRKANQLEIELDKSKQYYTIKRMSMIFHGQKFAWKPLINASREMGIPPIDVFDANYDTVKGYHIDVWQAVYAIGLDEVA